MSTNININPHFIRQMKKILVTGARGYIGQLLMEKISKGIPQTNVSLVGIDIIPNNTKAESGDLPNAIYLQKDIRDQELIALIEEFEIDTVIHLASIVRAPKNEEERQLFYDVEVNGLKNILDACVKQGVKRFIYTSSGAAYGYYEDHPSWITENTPLRGNESFTYAHHKKIGEQILAEYREKYPQLEQTIFRVSTILGTSTHNQITAFFEMPIITEISESDSRFVFIWDEDVVNCLYQAIFSEQTGIFNLTGDGALSLQQIATIAAKKRVVISAKLMRNVLKGLNFIGVRKFSPEQMPFLRFRPVLDNKKLKEEFGYIPAKSSEEVFNYFWNNRNGNV